MSADQDEKLPVSLMMIRAALTFLSALALAGCATDSPPTKHLSITEIVNKFCAKHGFVENFNIASNTYLINVTCRDGTAAQLEEP